MNNIQYLLKDLVTQQRITGASDIDVIAQWFMLNNQESEGIELIAKLSKSKHDKLDHIIQNAQLWIPSLPDMYESNNRGKNKLTYEHARKLTIITYKYLLYMELEGDLLEWAKETVPTLNTPTCIFNPMVDWLKDSYGIEFADQLR